MKSTKAPITRCSSNFARSRKTSSKEAGVRRFVYPARFERGDKAGVAVITFRDVPEAITQGKGERDALWQGGDCLEEAIAGRIGDGREIPKASRAARGERLIPVPAPMAAKAAL